VRPDGDERDDLALVEHRTDELVVHHVRPETHRIGTEEDVALPEVFRAELLDHVARPRVDRAVEQREGVAHPHDAVPEVRRRDEAGREVVPVAQDHRERRRQYPVVDLVGDVVELVPQDGRGRPVGVVLRLKRVGVVRDDGGV
jgi:hypothetical protein